MACKPVSKQAITRWENVKESILQSQQHLSEYTSGTELFSSCFVLYLFFFTETSSIAAIVALAYLARDSRSKASHTNLVIFEQVSLSLLSLSLFIIIIINAYCAICTCAREQPWL